MKDLLENHYLGFEKSKALTAWTRAYAQDLEPEGFIVEAKISEIGDGMWQSFYMVVSKKHDVDIDIATYLSAHLTEMNENKPVILAPAEW